MPETEETLTRDQVLQMAESHSWGEGAEQQNDPPAQRATGTEEQQAAEPEQKQEQQPETSVEQNPKEQQDDGDRKAESAYERAKKAQRRAAEQWQKIEAEKAALKRERDQIEQLKQQKQQGGDRFTPEDFERVAKDFEEEGNERMAELARQRAQDLRKEHQLREVQQRQAEVTNAWNTNLNAMVQSTPDLRDPESKVYKLTEQLLKKRPVLTTYPEGIIDAVEAAKAYVGAERAQTLEEQNKKLTEQVRSLQRKLGLTGGQPAPAPREKRLDDLPLKDQREAVLRAAQEHDTVAGFRN